MFRQCVIIHCLNMRSHSELQESFWLKMVREKRRDLRMAYITPKLVAWVSLWCYVWLLWKEAFVFVNDTFTVSHLITFCRLRVNCVYYLSTSDWYLEQCVEGTLFVQLCTYWVPIFYVHSVCNCMDTHYSDSNRICNKSPLEAVYIWNKSHWLISQE